MDAVAELIVQCVYWVLVGAAVLALLYYIMKSEREIERQEKNRARNPTGGSEQCHRISR